MELELGLNRFTKPEVAFEPSLIKFRMLSFKTATVLLLSNERTLSFDELKKSDSALPLSDVFSSELMNNESNEGSFSWLFSFSVEHFTECTAKVNTTM